MSSYLPLVCLSILEWSVRELARRLNTHQTTITRWAGGHSPVPCKMAAWLEALTAFHAMHPAPQSERRNPWRHRQGMHTRSAKVEAKPSVGHDRGDAAAVRVVGTTPRLQIRSCNPTLVPIREGCLQKTVGGLQGD